MSEQNLRDRKFWLFLPAVILPFLVFFFWLMGGGSKAVAEATHSPGFNTQLPVTKVQDGGKDKMAFYVAAEADSLRRLEQIRMDPYRKDSELVKIKGNAKDKSFVPMNAASEEIAKRVEAIRKKMAGANTPEAVYPEISNPSNIAKNTHTVAAPDPEMEAINGALDKILAIQHPAGVKEKPVEKKTAVYAVHAEAVDNDNSFFGRRDTGQRISVFHEDGKTAGVGQANGIAAVVDVTQILQTGSLIKMRLRAPIYVGGIQVPAGTIVFGICVLDQERLAVHIPSIGYAGNILPVSLAVYDLTGLPGIYAPGSLAGDVVKQTTDQSLASIGLLNLDPSVQSQLAAAGIGMAKNIFGRKVKQLTVTVKAGYQVILKEDHPGK